MSKFPVYLIAAVGQSGQIGLNGGMPWARTEGDLPWFRETTLHNVLIMGERTARSVNFDLHARRIVTFRRGASPDWAIEFAKKEYEFLGRFGPIWIAGGAFTYSAFLPFVERCFVSRLPYDGPADTWMPPLWNERPIETLTSPTTMEAPNG